MLHNIPTSSRTSTHIYHYRSDIPSLCKKNATQYHTHHHNTSALHTTTTDNHQHATQNPLERSKQQRFVAQLLRSFPSVTCLRNNNYFHQSRFSATFNQQYIPTAGDIPNWGPPGGTNDLSCRSTNKSFIL